MGFVAKAAPKGSATVEVALRGFYSSEDGESLIACLDGFSKTILDMIPPERRPRESQVEHLVASIRKDGKATVYVNELTMTAKFRAKRAVAAGQPVGKDEVADIKEIELGGVELSKDAALVVILSVGWRKGVYFDFTPIAPEVASPREIDQKILLAELFTYLVFQDRFRISDEQWTELFRQGWFPFIGLTQDQLRSILTHASLKAPIDPLLDEMVDDARKHAARLRELVANHAYLVEHKETLTRGLQHFESGDYLSSATMLYPRIEGVLRQRKAEIIPGKATQETLALAAISDPTNSRHSLSLLLPQKFRRFRKSCG